eukprot:488152-Prymnesium_polylepis.1
MRGGQPIQHPHGVRIFRSWPFSFSSSSRVLCGRAGAGAVPVAVAAFRQAGQGIGRVRSARNPPLLDAGAP